MSTGQCKTVNNIWCGYIFKSAQCSPGLMSAQLSRCVAVYSRHFVAARINAPVAVVFTLDHIVTTQTTMGWTKSLLYRVERWMRAVRGADPLGAYGAAPYAPRGWVRFLNENGLFWCTLEHCFNVKMPARKGLKIIFCIYRDDLLQSDDSRHVGVYCGRQSAPFACCVPTPMLAT